MIENAKSARAKYLSEHPDSLLPSFEHELHELGYEFEIPEQVKKVLPMHEKIISPIAIRYYKKAKLDNDKSYFVGLITCKGNDEIIKELLDDFQKENTSNFLREMIGNQLRKVKSEKFISEYLKIIENSNYGVVVGHFVDLLTSLKVDAAIPIFIKMLEDKSLRALGIKALANLKREEFRPYFERFENDKNSGLRKYAKTALKKLDIAKTKHK